LRNDNPLIVCAALGCILAVLGCNSARPGGHGATTSETRKSSSTPLLPKLAYFPKLKTPIDNPLSKEKIALGKMLFFDKRLSKDGKLACESCHNRAHGWSDDKPRSRNGLGEEAQRHTPSLFNVGYEMSWGWDGASTTLEQQVRTVWQEQLGARDLLAAQCKTLAALPAYRRAFKAAFGNEQIDPGRVVKALASFLRSIRSGNAPFDKSEQGNEKAISASARRGWTVFRDTAGCAACHAPPLFTDLQFHNVGVGYDKAKPAPGRAAISKDPNDAGRYKTPALRSVGKHPPYLHDGSAATLDEVVDFMLGGGRDNPNRDSAMKKITLSAAQRADLMAFIQALQPPDEPFEPPTLP